MSFDLVQQDVVNGDRSVPAVQDQRHSVVVEIDSPDEDIDQAPAGALVIDIAPFEGIQKGFDLRGGKSDLFSHFHGELRLQLVLFLLPLLDALGKLSEPLDIESGGTGASTAAGAIAALGGVKKSGDTMTGNLSIQGYLYPSMYLLPYYNNTTNRTVFEGSYVGASSFASWEDSTGNNRRMLEVRTKGYENSLDNAVMLRVADAGVWSNYRVFHAGMPSGVPVANGGTGATTAANARSNLGANNASNLTTGIIPAARLPFKVAHGSGSVSGSSALTINYSAAGFTSVPHVVASYSTTGSNWSGDNGALKIYSKTTTGATIIVGGSFNTSRNIDWIAIGT